METDFYNTFSSCHWRIYSEMLYVSPRKMLTSLPVYTENVWLQVFKSNTATMYSGCHQSPRNHTAIRMLLLVIATDFQAGDSITSLGNICQFSITHTAQKYFLVFGCHYYFSVCTHCLFSWHHWKEPDCTHFVPSFQVFIGTEPHDRP